MAFDLDDIRQRVILDASQYLKGIQDVTKNAEYLEQALNDIAGSMRVINSFASAGINLVTPTQLANLNTAVGLFQTLSREQERMARVAKENAQITRALGIPLDQITGQTRFQWRQFLKESGGLGESTAASPAQVALMKQLLGVSAGTVGATPQQVAEMRRLLGMTLGTVGMTKSQRKALGLEESEASDGGAGGVTAGLHPYYLMHQFHTMWVEGGNTITYAIRAGLSEISTLVAHGVQVGMASLGHQVAQILHASLGIGTAIGSGIGGIGSALGGGISRYGQAYAQGVGGMFGAGISGVGTAVTAGIIFTPLAGAITGLVGVANVAFEAVKMKVDMSMAAMSTGFHLGVTGAQVLGGTLSELTEKFLTLGGEMEQARVTVTAFAQDSGQMFETLLRLTREMPIYSFKELTEQMKTLVAEGIPLNQVEAMLQRLGDIAHGDEAIFHRAALAVGEIYAQGAVTSQRIRQLASIGIGTHDLAQAMGLSDPEFKGRLQARRVDVQALVDAINMLTDPGGRFAGQNEKLLGTMRGQWQRLRTIVDQTFGRIGEALIERSGLRDALRSLANWFENNFGKIQEIAFAVFDRIRVAFEVVVDYAKAGWDSLTEAFGLSGKSINEILPSLEQVRDITKELMEFVKSLAPAFIDFVRLGLETGLELLEKYQRYGGKKGEDWTAWLFRSQTSGLPDTDLPFRAGSMSSRILKKFDSFTAKLLAGGGSPGGPGLSEMAFPEALYDKLFKAEARRRIELELKFSPAAQELLMSLTKLMEKGGPTEFGQMQESLRLSNELRAKSLTGALGGLVGGVGILNIPEIGQDVEEIWKKAAIGDMQLFDRILQHAGAPEKSLTPAAFANSAAAVDIINKSSMGAVGYQERVVNAMEIIEAEAAETNRILRDEIPGLLRKLGTRQPEETP